MKTCKELINMNITTFCFWNPKKRDTKKETKIKKILENNITSKMLVKI